MISVQEHAVAGGWTCTVTVSEDDSESRHTVTVKDADYQNLAKDGEAPAELVRRSFEFLLAREPKESILSSFDVTVIGHYFPEFSSEIRK